MLPTLTSRLMAIFGVTCGCAAIFLSEWGVPNAPRWVWEALSALAVGSLLLVRQMPKRVVNDAELRVRVGDAPVNALNRLQNVGLLLGVLALGGAFLAAIFPEGVRRGMLVVCGLLLAGALTCYATVELRFRAMVSRSGVHVSDPR